MSHRIAPMWHVLGAEVALAVGVLALGIVSVGTATPGITVPLAGVGAGCAVAATLGVRLRVPRGLARDRARSLVGVGVVLTLGSACEEVIWRGLALGLLAEHIGVAAALGVSTIGFALFHLEPRAALTNLVTGAAFGGVFVATGSLLAAILAHATYNLSVLLAVESRRSARPAAAALRPPDLPTEATVIEVRDVTKSYGAIEALRGLDLEVGRGEVVAILGPNGAGKTTAIQIMLGLRRPDSGTARVLGYSPGDVRCRRRTGVTLQEMACPHTLRVREIVSFVSAHFDDPPAPDDVLQRFGLDELARRQVGGLSGGQRRRLALALPFASRPELVFLDEPTTGLDVESRRDVWDEIRAFAGAGGTVVLTTHSLEEAERLASRVVVMRAGRSVWTGSPDRLRTELGAPSFEDAFLRLTGGGQ